MPQFDDDFWLYLEAGCDGNALTIARKKARPVNGLACGQGSSATIDSVKRQSGIAGIRVRCAHQFVNQGNTLTFKDPTQVRLRQDSRQRPTLT